MGSMLAAVKTGRIIRPVNILIYGLGGIGKTTWAAKAPHPIFLGAEEGTDHINVARIPKPRSFDDVLTAVKELREDEHPYKTLVVDSLDWIEPLVFKSICRRYKKNSIEQCAGGYGKGYIEAANDFMDLLERINELRDHRGMHVIMIAHPETKVVTNPQTQMSYQRYELKLHKYSKAKVMEAVDGLFFASYEVYSQKIGDEAKPLISDRRVLQGVPNQHDGFDAKNRYGLLSPISMDTPWDEFLKICNLHVAQDTSPVKDAIKKLITMISDEAIKDKAEEFFTAAKDNLEALEKLHDRLVAIVNQ